MFKGSWLCAIFFILLSWMSISTFAQESKYWVYFTDKKGETFDPQTYFHPAAIDRRENAGIPLFDSTDFPVSSKYQVELQSVGAELQNESRWLNAVSCLLTEEERFFVQEMPFVERVELIASTSFVFGMSTENLEPDIINPSSLNHQTEVLGGTLLREHSLNGKGIRIAVFDVGFKGYESSSFFQHLRNKGLIERTYDFVGKDEKVGHSNAHGTKVLSCLAGEELNTFTGLAGGATFLLARTERNSIEIKSEEDCWIAAAEWADKHGVHIINSSLGYTDSRYFKKEMNGKTAPVSIAATMAARKGILVVTAAGNEGDEQWKFVAAPGDADSVLTVGGINPFSGLPSSFSSFGPTADGRLKPNVVAHGTAFCSSPLGSSQEIGTSFSSPLIAGFAACIWQHNKTLTNMEVLDIIQSSASLYPHFDYSMGYGLPNASRYFHEEETHFDWEFEEVDCNYVIEPTDHTTPTKYQNKFGFDPLIYYSFLSDENEILSFGAAYIQGNGQGFIRVPKEYENANIRVSFLGTVKEIR